ncbi:MAG: GHKL domain-containing protein, partial [Calditrichaeota bacterium]|nr:GHKL domain-containing protein [Calditrichota bacterium]
AEKRGAFIGMGDNALDDRQGPAYRKQWKKLYDRALANERFTQIITKEEADGKTRFIEYLFNPITAYNEVMGVAVLGLDITRRKEDEAEKIRLNQELNEAARRAGMADVAASVLHNVGNVLTSVTTSVSVIEQTMSNSRMAGLYKANDMLRENMENLAHFIANDPKGKKLIQYYMMLEDQIKSEQDVIFSNLHRLQDKVNIINEVIAAQQSYATGSMLSENLYLPQVIDDALRLQGDTTDRHHIELIEEYEDNIPEVPLQRTKLIHIIVNLFRNAKDAMKDTPMDEKQIKIRLNRENEHLVLRFSDSGCGIEPENVERIFNHGFTTKATGHGFGLHSCANYITEMGGRMWVESEGLGKGSTFVLQFPLAAKQGQETPEIIDEEV